MWGQISRRFGVTSGYRGSINAFSKRCYSRAAPVAEDAEKKRKTRVMILNLLLVMCGVGFMESSRKELKELKREIEEANGKIVLLEADVAKEQAAAAEASQKVDEILKDSAWFEKLETEIRSYSYKKQNKVLETKLGERFAVLKPVVEEEVVKKDVGLI